MKNNIHSHNILLSKHILILSVIIIIASCKKDEEVWINPYDVKDSTIVLGEDSIPNANFAYIQEKVFLPTCANSGCHDGTFEPDFRTVSSSYNTNVNQAVITNDGSGSFTFRVKPGSANKSLLYVRLTTFIANTSGVMPLSLEPESDWPNKKDEYIKMIEDWINNGALDLNGNKPPG